MNTQGHKRYGRTFACLYLFVVASFAFPPPALGTEPQAELLLAFTSFRERTLHPVVHFYGHDARANGKIVGKITPVTKRSDHHPALGGQGKSCVFAAELEGQISVILYWDVAGQKMVELPLLNKTPNTQMAPTFSSNPNLICFEAWNRAGSAGRWDLVLYDVRAKTVLETPDLNDASSDERKPALSGDGRWIAYTTNAATGAGLTDIRLYDRTNARALTPTSLNSPYVYRTGPQRGRPSTGVRFGPACSRSRASR